MSPSGKTVGGGSRAGPPRVVVVGGPNGAGKSTCAAALVRDTLGIGVFVNADLIAEGLSAFTAQAEAMRAGRIMLARLRDLAGRRKTFAFETTLASRAYVPWLEERVRAGYEFHLHFLHLASPDLAVARVAERVRLGGHSVPEDVVRRRYERGLKNFFRLYRPLARTWRIYDNSAKVGPRLVACGGMGRRTAVKDRLLWTSLERHYGRP